MLPFSMTQDRLQRLTLALLLGLVIGYLLFLVAGKHEGSALLRGDFPAFHAAAELVWTGQGAELYDLGHQRAIQNRHWPDFAGSYYIFAYPPFFALLLAPLAALPPLAGKALASLLLFAAFLGSLLLARRLGAFVSRYFLFTFVYLLTFAPLQIAIVGVQNTALSLFLFGLVLWGVHTEHPWRTGISVALLCYKPQFGALLAPFLLARRQRGEVLAWGLGLLALYLLGVPVLGWTWPLAWFLAAHQFGEVNFTINAHNMISLAGLSYWLFEASLGAGALALPWAYLGSAVLLLLAAWYLSRDARRLVLAPALVLLCSPQTLFYDVAIALLALLLQLRPGERWNFLVLAVIWLYGAVALVLRDQVAFPLFSPLLLAIIALQWRLLRAPSPPHPQR